MNSRDKVVTTKPYIQNEVKFNLKEYFGSQKVIRVQFLGSFEINPKSLCGFIFALGIIFLCVLKILVFVGYVLFLHNQDMKLNFMFYFVRGNSESSEEKFNFPCAEKIKLEFAITCTRW